MNYNEFRSKMFDQACFSIDQVFAWQPGFDRNNLSRWIKKGLLIRLRQGWFTFSEYKGKPDFAFYFANRIYRPSYISLHTALAFYGLIPEAVTQVTSVTPLKTAFFINHMGDYSYKTIKKELMFGYILKPLAKNMTLQMAEPEKAILDLLYLYPEYNTEKELEELRLDEDYLHADLNRVLLMEYTNRFQSKAMEHRVQMLIKTYGL
jgi:predicted transcriptional regulator of viral defense system